MQSWSFGCNFFDKDAEETISDMENQEFVLE
jgi:hypothetical protein